MGNSPIYAVPWSELPIVPSYPHYTQHPALDAALSALAPESWTPAVGREAVHPKTCLAESVDKVVLQKSIPAQIRQRILYISINEGYVDGFVWELTFAERLDKHFFVG
jgi:hypothetical protein